MFPRNQRQRRPPSFASPFADPTAVTVLGWAEREPELQHEDHSVAVPELPKDDRGVLGIGRCWLSAIAVAFGSASTSFTAKQWRMSCCFTEC
jgi:hypothetical protein